MSEEMTAKWAKLVELLSNQRISWTSFTAYNCRFSSLHVVNDGNRIRIETPHGNDTVFVSNEKELGDFIRSKAPEAKDWWNEMIFAVVLREVEISVLESKIKCQQERLKQLKQER